VLALLTAWTRGPIRWRLDFEQGGHRRALVWAAAARARELAPALRNQPRATTWEVVVTTDQRHLEVRPHRYTDDRFTWRQADVPAASHPTVAAALARVAGARDGEHVWDPFCGSGAELCERGRLGPAPLHGTDLDERALAAARANLDAAGLAATLTRADALTHQPPPLGLVITNPPLGRRLRGDAGLLLERFAARVPSLLAPGGRLVWITPAPDRTGPVLRHGKLALRFARDVDLGGYEVRLERWDR
jgi:23S rRNA G2445 N2-methylase RlmL